MWCFMQVRNFDPSIYKVQTHLTQLIWETLLIKKTLLGIAVHYAYPQLPRETHSQHPAVTEISHYAVKLYCWDHICIIKWIRVLLTKKSSLIAVITTPRPRQMWPANVTGHISPFGKRTASSVICHSWTILTLASIKYNRREASQKLHINSQVPTIKSKAAVEILLIKYCSCGVGFLPHCTKPAAPLKHSYIQTLHRYFCQGTAWPTVALATSAENWVWLSQPGAASSWGAGKRSF